MKQTKILFLAAIILAVGGAIGYHSYQKNQEPELSKLAIANIEALTSLESYTLLTCYEHVIENNDSQFSYRECKTGTSNSLIYDCAGGKSVQGHTKLLVKMYYCVK